jgi:pimeloyl-ACP methyl ester carboxylesterase
MTVTGRLTTAAGDAALPSVHTTTVRVKEIPFSARVCSAPRPRAVILALHGGGTTSHYFDCPGRPDLSLLRTGAALGYAVVAMDRPGYGISAPYATQFTHPQQRVDLTYGALSRFLDQLPGRAPVFVAGHSAGCELAVRMVADARGQRFLGLEIAGAGLRHDPETARALQVADQTRRAGGRPTALRETLWGSPSLYTKDVWTNPHIGSPSPQYEIAARSWVKEEFAQLASQVQVPVQFSLGDHEKVWESGPAALAEITDLFTASPWVRANEQGGCGHNLSLGLAARSYHLRLLSFVEECVVLREQAQAKGEAA